MEALLNKRYQQTDEDEEDLELKIQKELDNYQYNDNSPVNKSTISLNKTNRSFVDKDELADLDAWKDCLEARKDHDKMYEKFQRNIKILKDITFQFKETEEEEPNNDQINDNMEEKQDNFEINIKDEENIENNQKKTEVMENLQNKEEMEKLEKEEKNEIIDKNDENNKNLEKSEKKDKIEKPPKNEKNPINIKNSKKTSKNPKFEKSLEKKSKNEKSLKILQKSEKFIPSYSYTLSQEPLSNIDTFFKKPPKKPEIMTSLSPSDTIISQELEWLRMEKEDNNSRKYEDFLFKEAFSFRFFQLPKKLPIKPSFLLKTENIQQKLNFLQISTKIELPELLTNIPKNLLPKNSKVTCLLNIKQIVNPIRKITFMKKTSEKTSFNEKTFQNINAEVKIYRENIKIDIKGKNNNISFFFEKIDKIHENIKNSLKIDEKLKSLFLQKQEIQSLGPYEPFSNKEKLTENLDFEETDINSKKSLNFFISKLSQKQTLELDALEYKYENIIDFQGIESLKNLKYLILSMNKLTIIPKNMGFSSKLIEVNLAQNGLVDYIGLKGLKYLRFLYLEMNNIDKISALEGCDCLETLNLNKNSIKKIENLDFNKNLIRLFLYQNSIEKIENLDKNIALEELDLGRNMISIMEGLDNLISLRKLILYNNKIQYISKDFSHFLLIELFLNNNNISSIDKLHYLPSLHFLNLENNEIQVINENTLKFFPNLTVLKLSYNKIGSFLSIFAMVCKHKVNNWQLRVVNYEENPFFQDINKESSDFYEEVLEQHCPNLIEINGNRKKPKIVMIYNEKEGKFDKKLNFDDFNQKSLDITENSKELEKNNQIRKMMIFNKISLISLFAQEYTYISQLDSKKFKKSPFLKEKSYFLRKLYINYYTHLLTNEPFTLPYNIYYEKEAYEQSIMRKSRKIMSLLIKNSYNLKKIRRFYMKNMDKLVILQKNIRGYIVRRCISLKSIKKDKILKEKGVFALKIQKVFKGYLLRKKKKFLFNKIKYQDKEIDEFQEIDANFEFNEKNYDFELKLPGNLDIEEFLSMGNKTLEIGNGAKSLDFIEKPSNNKKKLPPIENFNSNSLSSDLLFQKIPHGMNNSINKSNNRDDSNIEIESILSRKTSNIVTLPKIEKKNKEDEKAKKIMEAWGLNKPEIQETLAYKLEKERKRKEGKNKKTMNAEERYAKFVKSIKK